MAELNREKVIVRTGVIGIVANALLAGFKAAVGMLSGSIAIVLDAVNNMSDALSSIITVSESACTASAGGVWRHPTEKSPAAMMTENT